MSNLSLRILLVSVTVGVVITVLGFVMCAPADANTLGVNFTQTPAANTLGVNGDLEHNIEVFTFDIEGQLNRQEDIWSTDTVIGTTIDLNDFGINFTDFRIESNIFGQIGEVSFEGTYDFGLGFVVPIKNVNISVGYFRKQGNPFAPQYQLIDSSNPDSGSELVGDPINVLDGSSDNLALKADFDLSVFEIGARGLLQLTGVGDENHKIHQFKFDTGTGGKLSENITWAVGSKVSVDFDSESEDTANVYLTSTNLTIGYTW